MTICDRCGREEGPARLFWAWFRGETGPARDVCFRASIPLEPARRTECEIARGDRLERERDEARVKLSVASGLRLGLDGGQQTLDHAKAILDLGTALAEARRERDEARAMTDRLRRDFPPPPPLPITGCGCAACTSLRVRFAAPVVRELPTVREACRRRMPLDGVDAEALNGALSITERERDEARALLARCGALVSGGTPRWDEAVRLVEDLARIAEERR